MFTLYLFYIYSASAIYLLYIYSVSTHRRPLPQDPDPGALCVVAGLAVPGPRPPAPAVRHHAAPVQDTLHTPGPQTCNTWL